MNRALLIAYHFPPIRVSSGLQRTLANTRYLPEFGWTPIVLSAHPRAYEHLDEGQLRDIPPSTVVDRAFALDTARHLAIRGRYSDLMALPDRWCTWWLGGVTSGLKLIRRYRPRAIWSTYPIATAHLIGLTLKRLTGLPWIADFRDSMTEAHYPRESRRRKAFLWIEGQVIRHCDRAVFTSPGAQRLYAKRYPDTPPERWAIIPNGYNESIFAELEAEQARIPAHRGGARPMTLVHSGVIYPSERDPRPLFQALSNLKTAGVVSAATLRILLRATGHDHLFRPMLAEYDIDDLVSLAPGIGYRDALREMLTTDALLVLQAANCNHQIPAKIYEYFRARRPVLALTDPAGDTAATIRNAGIDAIAPLDDANAIATMLREFVANVAAGRGPVATESAITRASRRQGAGDLACLFETCAD